MTPSELILPAIEEGPKDLDITVVMSLVKSPSTIQSNKPDIEKKYHQTVLVYHPLPHSSSNTLSPARGFGTVHTAVSSGVAVVAHRHARIHTRQRERQTSAPRRVGRGAAINDRPCVNRNRSRKSRHIKETVVPRFWPILRGAEREECEEFEKGSMYTKYD